MCRPAGRRCTAMSARRAFAGSLALATVIMLVGCARAEVVSSYPTFDPAADEVRQRAQADAVLTRWADLHDASPTGFFLLGQIGVGYVGQWEGDNHKAAAEFGHLVAPQARDCAGPARSSSTRAASD